MDDYAAKAREIAAGLLPEGTPYRVTLAVATALREARADGMRRAAEIAEDERKRHDTGSGFDSQPAYTTAHSIRATILAEAEKGR